ncbi:MAG: hypothetical protein KKC68_01860 [Candidatus Thermoplasmatota archaeon]|nr:hypothetical protein [Candidatus Thermoplasmatota archaeon]
MKKNLPILIAGIFILSSIGAVASTHETITTETLTLHFSQPHIETTDDYLTITLDHTNNFLTEQGKPLLPSYTQKFVYPLGTHINTITCQPSNINTQTLTKTIQPTPPTIIVGQTLTTKQKPITYDTTPYPTTWYTYNIQGGLHNKVRSTILEIEVFPIKYHPTSNLIEYTQNIEITIDYTLPPSTQPNPVDYELLIIAPNEYSDELAPLITHKIDRGITTKFTGLIEIYGGTGRDNQEKIKYYIKDAIETWQTTAVLLVGSSTKLPTRTTNIQSITPPDSEIFVSDLYYADIYNDTGGFCSWDYNTNNIFGQYYDTDNIDQVDLLPDVYIGRWPAVSGTQVTTCVNKVKNYEDSEAYKQYWFTNMVVCGGDTSPDYDIIEGEYVNQKVIDLMVGFTATKCWVTNGVLTGYTPTGVNAIKNAINAGAGFVDFSGHGNTDIWATHPEESHSWVPTPTGGIRDTDIATLANGNKLPIVAVEACSTAKFNQDSNCFNWAFLAKSNGGAIGAFGATALGWGYTGTGITQGLIGKMGLDTFRAFKLDDSFTLGEMWYNALDRYITPSMDALDFKTTEEWILFGDPTLKIGEPSTPPEKPQRPGGKIQGKAGESYTYTTSTTDPDGDTISYQFDWGDNTTSDWVGPYSSGQTAEASKTWTEQGTYEIRVIARDELGKLSSWSEPLVIQMPLNKAAPTPVILRFLQNHPYLYHFLQQLIGLYHIVH